MAERRGHVWYGRRLVGALRADDEGRLRFSYDGAWTRDGFPISVRLPLETGAEVHAHSFFEGLLPEGRARGRICRQLKIAEDDDARLLFAIGRDCAGALSVLPGDEEPGARDGGAQHLDEEDLLGIVESRGAMMDGAIGPRRFSLAGAQDKMAVVISDAQDPELSLPGPLRPSSHILKFETLPWVCFSEYMGADLARRAGLEGCAVEYRALGAEGGTPYLRVRRYDRRREGERLERIHQEDIAQALGYGSDQKYQSDGGPSLGDVAALLRTSVADPIVDITRLRDWQIFNYLIGNSDAHAKNLALLYDSESGLPRLAPFYDLVCIEFQNRIGATRFDRSMAFHVGERSLPEEIRRVDWESLARSMRVSPRGVVDRLVQLAESLPGLASAAREAFVEERGDNQVFDRFEETIADRCRWVLNSIGSR